MLQVARIAILLAASVILTDSADAANPVGSAAAVRNDVRGSIGGALRSGSPVHQSETIAAGSESSAQLLFRDKTSLTIGPSSQVVIDRFVYDPQSGAGGAAIAVAKGALRFVTGMQASSNYTVRTPSASIGVRGSIIEMFVSELGYEVFVLIEGAFEVCTIRDCRTMTVPGQYVVIQPNGTLSQPAGWTGPMLDLTNSLNFLETHFGTLFERGNDPLPRYRDQEDALRTDGFGPPELCTDESTDCFPDYSEGDL